MTAVALAPFLQLETNGGIPLAGGKVESYQAGTLIPLATYTDRAAGTPNANPVVLDSSGRADIWLTANVPYKLILKDSAGNVIDSVDNFYAGADPAQLTAAGIVPSTGGTFTGDVTFAGGVTFAGTPAQELATLDSLSIAPVTNYNLFLNSGFVSIVGTVGSYADGSSFFANVAALCDTGNVTMSQLNQPQDGIPHASRTLQPDAAPKRMGFAQKTPSEIAYFFRAKNLSLTAKVRSSVSTAIRCALVAWTGAADAAPADVVNNWASTNYTAGNFFIANTSTIAVTATAVTAGAFTDIFCSSTSAGGVVAPSSMTQLYMVVWTDTAQAQNVTLDASAIECGEGISAQKWTPIDALAVFEGQWSSQATVVVPSAGAFGNANCTIRFLKLGKMVMFNIVVNVITNGTGSGSVLVTIPWSAKVSSSFAGRETLATGVAIVATVGAGASALAIFKYDNTYPAGSGYALSVGGVLEVA